MIDKKVVFSKPLQWEGKEYKEIELKIDTLKGRDLIDIQTDMKVCGVPIASHMEVDEAYLARLAAKAAGVETEIIEALDFKDFRRVINKTMGLMRQSV